ncbi:MazG nucleotide pyrophosphohydrolase domain-containing protein [Anaerosolibacter sp.]|uniref:MazG nucleotide pyrophosphohydrolase domain-containing protein n=1 Tax=Anaerosolibacter sp. TaxID=1872527 RepID=UPI0039EE2F81
MIHEITINQLQEFIKNKDYNPDAKNAYFLKLIEEVGELSEAIRKDARLLDGQCIKGTIEEELYDVLYYIVALANVYNINIEECARLKEALNKKKYDYKCALNGA